MTNCNLVSELSQLGHKKRAGDRSPSTLKICVQILCRLVTNKGCICRKTAQRTPSKPLIYKYVEVKNWNGIQEVAGSIPASSIVFKRVTVFSVALFLDCAEYVQKFQFASFLLSKIKLSFGLQILLLSSSRRYRFGWE